MSLEKRKYHKKVLSDSGISVSWIRCLDVAPLFAEYVWLNIPVFDLTQLGMGLIYGIPPSDYLPYKVDYQYSSPTVEEMGQGIWANFTPTYYELVYKWMADLKTYIEEHVSEELAPTVTPVAEKKARYGITPYDVGLYDPTATRDFIRSTFYKLFQMRTSRVSFFVVSDEVEKELGIVGSTNEHIMVRLNLMFSLQLGAFVLGLAVLGVSPLSSVENGKVTVPVVLPSGEVVDVRFRRMEDAQLGFILGVTPLGLGMLVSERGVYKLPDGKRNPPSINLLFEKCKGIFSRLSLTPFAYGNYNRASEMADPHRSDRTTQYHELQTQRKMIEAWVERMLPAEEKNPVKLRAYKNAVLQLVGWRAKRHRWGFEGWESMVEWDFREWWLGYWGQQGLNRSVLSSLYEGARWLRSLRERKKELGRKLSRVRRRLTLSPAT